MARKSAAEFKPVNNSAKADLPPIEETFEKAKQVIINTLEVSIKLAGRIDNLLNIRDYALKFWGNELDNVFDDEAKVRYFKTLQGVSITAYQAVLEATKSFALEDFLKEDMPDYYEEIIPSVDDVTSTGELCVAGLIFLTVKPFGEKMTALHHQMLDEKSQRELA